MSDPNTKLSRSQLAELFMINFNKRKEELSNQIDELTPESGPNINEKLTNLAKEIQLLSKQLHDAVMFLPSYSVKMRQNEIRDLEKLLKDKEDLLIPKKRFGFKSKFTVPPPAPVEAGVITHEKNQPDSQENQSPKNDNVKSMKTDNYFTIENINGQSVQHTESELNGNDVLVKNCEDAIIKLEGGPSTLRLVNLVNCKLLCGPVRTSIFVDSVRDSILFLCCQQLRTHSSEKVDIYLRVGSRAIIEDCKAIRFGPYRWDHVKSDALHKLAEINPGLERYDAIDDFNWLSSTASPNWCLILPEDYISGF